MGYITLPPPKYLLIFSNALASGKNFLEGLWVGIFQGHPDLSMWKLWSKIRPPINRWVYLNWLSSCSTCFLMIHVLGSGERSLKRSPSAPFAFQPVVHLPTEVVFTYVAGRRHHLHVVESRRWELQMGERASWITEVYLNELHPSLKFIHRHPRPQRLSIWRWGF